MRLETIRQESAEFWNGRLARVHSSAIPAGILPDTTSYLTEVGLPTERRLEVTFYTDDRLLRPTVVDGTTYFAVSDDLGIVLGVLADTEELWCVDSSGAIPRRFVNSHIAAFTAFLGIVDLRYRTQIGELSAKRWNLSVRKLRRWMRDRDPLALDHDENWWAVILEQMEHGLL